MVQRRKQRHHLLLLSTTLKDRLRSRTHSYSHNLPHRNNTALFAERLVTRLAWARQALHAGTAWLRSPANGTNNIANGQHQQQEVVIRYETVMDANWWFWNLLLAATPSLIIAGYCELVVKPKMDQLRYQNADDGAATIVNRDPSAPLILPANATMTSPSLHDAWDLLVAWMQQGGDKTGDSNPVLNAKKDLADTPIGGRPDTKLPPSTSSTSTSEQPSPERYQQQQQEQLAAKFLKLKHQMQELEQEIKTQQQTQLPSAQSHDSTATPPTSQNNVVDTISGSQTIDPNTRLLSPLQQRRQERQRLSITNDSVPTNHGTTTCNTDDAGISTPQATLLPAEPATPTTTSSNSTAPDDKALSTPYGGIWKAVTRSIWKSQTNTKNRDENPSTVANTTTESPTPTTKEE